MVEILPAILEKSFEAVQEKVARLSGIAGRAQLDIADGVFVPEESWPDLSKMDSIALPPGGIQNDHAPPTPSLGGLGTGSRRGGDIQFDLHLMVEGPELWIERAAPTPSLGGLGTGSSLPRAGGDDAVFRITFHYEAAIDVRRAIGLVRKVGKEVGAALNLETPVSVLYDIIEQVDLALLMAVAPGAQGRQFDRRVLDKIKELRAHSPRVKIGVDGGVSDVVAPDLIKAGADVLVCGSWLWQQADLGGAIKLLQNF